MVQITIELPEDLEYMAKMSSLQLSLWAQKVIKERLEDLEKAERFKKIVSKSKATEKDVEELADEVNDALARHYSKY